MQSNASTQAATGRRWFIGMWAAVLLVKATLIAFVPLFVDEAFYWQEGRHLAWAYSDLPGLTAWLTRLGGVFGQSHAALRWPFLLLAGAVPWLIVAITRRLSPDPASPWWAGLAALALPLLGSLGVLALPDVPMTLATTLCLYALVRLLQRPADGVAAAVLALGLVIGGLSHYRFAAVIGLGGAALLAVPAGRALLRTWRFWVATALGAAAWLPLLLWNLQHADAGLRFQMVDRHPWAFHLDGWHFIPVQLAFVTPLLLPLLLAAGWRMRRDASPARRWLAWCGLAVVGFFFVMGFFVDNERVSFHWPLPGYLALLPLLATGAPGAARGWRRAALALAGLGTASLLAYYAIAAVPGWRSRLATTPVYPDNFAGWQTVAARVQARLARMPADTVLLADSFKTGAELGFLRGDPRIRVLDHPLNAFHGRAPQLVLWGVLDAAPTRPRLLVLSATDVPFKHLLRHYHAVCDQVGPLPMPEVVNIDHGRRRFLLLALPAGRMPGVCTTPAMAWVDAPLPGARVRGRMAVRGWAFRDGLGLRGVQVLVDGAPIADARYGLPMPGLAEAWNNSTDPQHPAVGFAADVDLSRLAPGTHWLGLRLHGNGGGSEDWVEQPIVVDP